MKQAAPLKRGGKHWVLLVLSSLTGSGTHRCTTQPTWWRMTFNHNNKNNSSLQRSSVHYKAVLSGSELTQQTTREGAELRVCGAEICAKVTIPRMGSIIDQTKRKNRNVWMGCWQWNHSFSQNKLFWRTYCFSHPKKTSFPFFYLQLSSDSFLWKNSIRWDSEPWCLFLALPWSWNPVNSPSWCPCRRSRWNWSRGSQTGHESLSRCP